MQVGWGVGVSRCKEARSPRGGSIWVPSGSPGWKTLLIVKCPIASPASLLTRRAKGLESRSGFQFRPQQRLGNEFRWALGESVSAGIPELVLQQVLDTIRGPG